MNKERFTFVCNETEEGRDAFVANLIHDEEGRVKSCSLSHVVVETSAGAQRCWDFSEVEEIAREKDEFPYR